LPALVHQAGIMAVSCRKPCRSRHPANHQARSGNPGG